MIYDRNILKNITHYYSYRPVSVNKYTNDLKIEGDAALYSIYNDVLIGDYPEGYSSGKLAHYLITNAYASFVSDLNNILPSTVQYNIYISNETKTMFWCSSFLDTGNSLTRIEPVTISHCIVAIDPAYLSSPSFGDGKSVLSSPSTFQDYDGSTYDVQLEMWYI